MSWSNEESQRQLMSIFSETPSERQAREREEQRRELESYERRRAVWDTQLAEAVDHLRSAQMKVFEAGHFTERFSYDDERREQAILNAIDTAIGLISIRRLEIPTKVTE